MARPYPRSRQKSVKKRVEKHVRVVRKNRQEVIYVGPQPKTRLVLRPFWRNLFKSPLYFFRALRSYPWRTAFSLALTILICVSAALIYQNIFKDLPAAEELTQKEQHLTTKIMDRHGTVLYEVYDQENRTLIKLSDVPPSMIQATLAIEDQDFYQHPGISIKGIARAAMANLKGGSVQGGSTITQQLVKTRLLTPERTWTRKLKESILAIMVERTYSKDQILEMYLNQVSYGGSTYGVEEAANRYFNKHAKDLTLAESALLAGLPAAPSAYTPFGPTPELAAQRQSEVLRRMVEEGFISQADADTAMQQPLAFKTDSINIQAPHFVMYVKQLLADKYGEEAINQSGLEVTTSLDLDLQNQVQTIVTSEVDKLAPLHISNGAALITNPGTGEILAMIGSKDYFDFAHDGQVNVTLRPRQPGSSIKPLTYALAFEKGYTPDTYIDDEPVTYQEANSKPYTPRNYDGRFHGHVTLREALASSYNIPAVKLLNDVGINNLLDFAQNIGISTWQDRQRFGLSLTLGGGEVLMTDMAKLYGTFANYGYTVDLNPILEIKTAQGDVLYQNSCATNKLMCNPRRTIPTQIAFEITNILSDNQARVPAFGTHSVLTIPNQEVAVKTGTTNNLRDNWAFGYTSDRLVGVWVGNNDNSPMSYVASGITGASPIWNDIIRLMLDDKNPHHFAAPDGLVKVAICTQTGTLPCAGCPKVQSQYFTAGTEPTSACTPASFAPTSSGLPQFKQPIASPLPWTTPRPVATPIPTVAPKTATPAPTVAPKPATKTPAPTKAPEPTAPIIRVQSGHRQT